MVLELPPESWGDRLRRARLYGKRRYGYSYRELAERVADFLPITDRAIITLERRDTVPTLRRQRVIAALYIVALGYAPEDFGIEDVRTLVPAYGHAGSILDELEPEFWSPRRRRRDERAVRQLAAWERAAARRRANGGT